MTENETTGRPNPARAALTRVIDRLLASGQEPIEGIEARGPSAFTIRHMGRWLECHAPLDPDIPYWRYGGALMRWCDDGGAERWEWAMSEGWPKAFREAETDGYFDHLIEGRDVL